jgi:hypothetical protein
MFQMAIVYANIFHSKALPNLPKLGFLVCKYTIWQSLAQTIIWEYAWKYFLTILSNVIATVFVWQMALFEMRNRSGFLIKVVHSNFQVPSLCTNAKYFRSYISYPTWTFGIWDTWEQGCQMVYFQTENPNLGKFWRALEWKRLVYYMAIWNKLWPFGIYYGHLV